MKESEKGDEKQNRQDPTKKKVNQETDRDQKLLYLFLETQILVVNYELIPL